MPEPKHPIQVKHNAIVNAFWNYNSQYVNDNGYKKSKVLTPEALKKLGKLEEAIKAIK